MSTLHVQVPTKNGNGKRPRAKAKNKTVYKPVHKRAKLHIDTVGPYSIRFRFQIAGQAGNNTSSSPVYLDACSPATVAVLVQKKDVFDTCTAAKPNKTHKKRKVVKEEK